jgi:hypothetical protein
MLGCAECVARFSCCQQCAESTAAAPEAGDDAAGGLAVVLAAADLGGVVLARAGCVAAVCGGSVMRGGGRFSCQPSVG